MFYRNNIIRTSLLCLLSLVPLTVNSQVGIFRTPIFEDESVRRNMAQRAAADARKEKEAMATIERERQQMKQMEVDFSAEREQERKIIAELPPNTPETERQIDLFNCAYPDNAALPPKSNDVDSCFWRRQSARDAEKQAAIDAQKRIEAERLIAEEARRLEEQKKAQEAEEAAKLAAAKAAEAEREKAAMYGMVVTLLGLISLLFAIYKNRQYGWASQSIAAISGGLSGFLLYMMIVMSIFSTPASISQASASALIFTGWIFSIHILLKGTKQLTKIIARSFLLGAAEWLLLIPVSFLFAGKAVTQAVVNNGESTAHATGAIIGGGLFALLSGGFSISMAVLCLICYAVTHFLFKEMKPDNIEHRIKCPECAELIKAEAKKCRFCGAVLTPLG